MCWRPTRERGEQGMGENDAVSNKREDNVKKNDEHGNSGKQNMAEKASALSMATTAACRATNSRHQTGHRQQSFAGRSAVLGQTAAVTRRIQAYSPSGRRVVRASLTFTNGATCGGGGGVHGPAAATAL